MRLLNSNIPDRTNTMDKKLNEFDEKAKTWDTQPDRAHRSQVIAESIIAAIPHNSSMTAMEYGCGTGLLSFPIKDRFSQITLIDNSQGMLDVLREKIKAENVTNMNVLNVDLLESTSSISKKFSVIYNLLVLHHIADVKKIMSIWYSLLTTPGYLCIADLDSDNGLFHGKDFKGHNGFNRTDLQKIAQETGFVNINFTSAYEIKKAGNDGIERSFPIFLMVAEKKAR
jgi:2-polyprenyl-3-methyl-5-hydroxy-6-metoxy-1,4-benzoquinol methylase